MEEIEGAKALDWARAENARSLPQLQKDARFKGLYDDALKILTASDRIPSVSFAGDGTLARLLAGRRVTCADSGARTTVESYRSGNPQWQTLLDLDALAKSEKANWVWHSPSCLPPEDRYCLVELSDGGKDAASVREFDTRTGTFDKNGFAIPEAKSSYAWLDRDTLLVAHEWKKGELTESGLSLHRQNGEARRAALRGQGAVPRQGEGRRGQCARAARAGRARGGRADRAVDRLLQLQLLPGDEPRRGEARSADQSRRFRATSPDG